MSRRGHFVTARVVTARVLVACVLVACAGTLATLASAAPAPAPAEEPTVDFIVVRADTLTGLSASVLTAPNAWREVARLNRLPDANRLRPGQRLRIPARLLRGDAVGATLVGAQGDVRRGESVLATGAALVEGDTVATGAGGSAVLELADGSRVRIAPSSLAEVAASRNHGVRRVASAASGGLDVPSHWFAGTLRVLRGSVEVLASKFSRTRPLEVVTPTAVVGVRGTRFRVGFDPAANGASRAEVVEGDVRVEAAGSGRAAALGAGFGAAVDASGAAPRIARLLEAPDLSTLPERFERPIVRFAVPAGAAAALRVQVAADDAFERIVSDQRLDAGAEVRITGLEDARWHVRARRIDPHGIEGFDAARPFVLKARPEPPASLAPRAGGKQAAGRVAFAWAPDVAAPQVRLQVAEDAAFERIVIDRDAVDAATLSSELVRPGLYHWRLTSIRPDGDHGPFGDAQRFELRPLPEPPSGGAAADGSGLVFRWSGRAEDRQRVELARDLAFTEIVESAELDGTEWALPKPARSGRYFFRYRSVEPDGFVSPYSNTLAIEVPRDWRGLGLLLPLLLLAL